MFCQSCGRRLVFVAMVAGGKMFKTWQCDCEYRIEDDNIVPPEIISEIVRAREWDDGSIVYDVEKGTMRS